MSSSDPTRVKSYYIPVYTTILRQIERCPYVADDIRAASESKRFNCVCDFGWNICELLANTKYHMHSNQMYLTCVAFGNNDPSDRHSIMLPSKPVTICIL